eukprot:TRINITY_DN31533_c0_g1_i1.p1 TRINITY_DN31533_c0_g1~~TRINITY_DN31533_c0_g1_i1.p1  ORF type:complete len:398 (+),score=68.89 TRINITY_DN31533_c0_g1_i1:54-1247(+)
MRLVKRLFQALCLCDLLWSYEANAVVAHGKQTSPPREQQHVRRREGSLVRREGSLVPAAGAPFVEPPWEWFAVNELASLADGFGEQETGDHEELTFYLRDVGKSFLTLEGYQDLLTALLNHPARVMDESAARFSVGAFGGCFAEAFANLPKRDVQRPYLLWGHDRCDKQWLDDAALGTRSDILLVGYDLRPFERDNATTVPGITYAPPFMMKDWIHRHDPSAPARFLLTFRGDNKHSLYRRSSVRPDLNHSFSLFPKPRDVIVDFYAEGAEHNSYPVHYEELFNSSFILVPRGHGRWSYRFTEAVQACSVPVVMSDGWTMPYEQLIDWSTASLRLPEKLAKEGAKAILASLPTDPAKLRRMRQAVCDIRERFFRSERLKAEAMLNSAVALLRTQRSE